MLELKRSISPHSAYRGLEVSLLILVAVLLARLVWAIVTPAGPLGEARPTQIALQGNDNFDPFFRVDAQPGSMVVTSLALKLFGVRVDEAVGGGSAIIETPDGVQSSFGVGDEIMPGVILKQVAFDSVTIDRNGAAEQLFLDQSVAAPVAKVATPTPVAEPEAPQAGDGGKVAGITIAPGGAGDMMLQAGLQPGDRVMAVNGQPVNSIETVTSQLSKGGSVSLQVERAGRTISLTSGAPKK